MRRTPCWRLRRWGEPAASVALVITARLRRRRGSRASSSSLVMVESERRAIITLRGRPAVAFPPLRPWKRLRRPTTPPQQPFEKQKKGGALRMILTTIPVIPSEQGKYIADIPEQLGIPTPLLTIHPEEPLVERGGSIRLTCALDCPGGKVQWTGLDTDLGNIMSNHTYSVLTIFNATVNSEGEKTCVGQCHRKPLQKKVALRVFSFPDTLRLESQPEMLKAGQPARLSCSLSHISPPGSLTLSWFQGAEQLDASVEEEEMAESREQLFEYRSVLEVPAAPVGAAYKCQATLDVGRHTFRQEKVANVNTEAAQKGPEATEKTTSAFQRTSHAMTPKPLTPGWWISSFTAATTDHLVLRSTQDLTSATSRAASTVASALAGTESSEVETSHSPAESSVTETQTNLLTPEAEATSNGTPAVTLPPATSHVSASTGRQSTLETVSTHNRCPSQVATDRPEVHTPKEGPCRPVIKPEPSQGGTGKPLRITCHLPECGGRVQIRWVGTPVALSQYQLEEGKDRSTLMVASAGKEHQGVYRCLVISSQAWMESLRVVVLDDPFPAPIIAAGTVGSLLGLLVTGYVAHRTWHKRAS
uniref:Mucosal addressin cell adhesion molecule 1 isoform X1 n=1 Tax=Pogona vitticeps TaxID=103695 RepID=A0A6J0TSB1_9SAUR